MSKKMEENKKEIKSPFLDISCLTLILNKGSLNDILLCSDFPTQLSMNNKELLEYLRQDSIVTLMIKMISQADNFLVEPQSAQCILPFHSHLALCSTSDHFISRIYKNKKAIKALFNISVLDTNLYQTAQGYFMSIIKSHLSYTNDKIEEFIGLVIDLSGELIFPLVHSFSYSNMQIIKLILCSNTTSLNKLQFSLFEYILYYILNEKFVNNEPKIPMEDFFSNIRSLFEGLLEEGTHYDYKLKYENNLYSTKYIKSKKYLEELLLVRLSILKYIAGTGQLKFSTGLDRLLSDYRKFKDNKIRRIFIHDLLIFMERVSLNPSFNQVNPVTLVRFLFRIMEENPSVDILIHRIRSILQNLISKTNDEKINNLIISEIDRLVSVKKSLKNEQNRVNKEIPFSIFSNIMKQDKPPKLGKLELSLWNNLVSFFKDKYPSFEAKDDKKSFSAFSSSEVIVSINNPSDLNLFSIQLNEDDPKQMIEQKPKIDSNLVNLEVNLRNSLIIAENSNSLKSSLLSSNSVKNLSNSSQKNNLRISGLNSNDNNQELGLSSDNLLLLSESDSKLSTQ